MKKRYRLVEFEKMPIKVVMNDVTIDEIAERMVMDKKHCYPRDFYIQGKYKVMRQDEMPRNRYMEYFYMASMMVAEMKNMNVEDVMKMVMRVVENGR